MSKGIGFNRNICLSWLDATASFCGEIDDPVEIRARLEPVVGQQIASDVNRRKAIDILINIWSKSGKIDPALRTEAVERFQTGSAIGDRLWLHFGLALLRYSIFRDVTSSIGQLTRYREWVSPGMVKRRLISQRGPLGSLEKAVERVMWSLREWGILSASDRRHTYACQHHVLVASSADVEAWLLACALRTHPAEEVPFIDLVRLPELFPFRFSLGVEQLGSKPWFAVRRQGVNWDMVRLASTDVAGGRGSASSDEISTILARSI